MPPVAPPATAPADSPRGLAAFAAAFAAVPDPRRQASVIHPLPAILTLAVAALLANHLSVLASAQWGARQSPALLRRLGFPAGRAPCQSTLQRLFAKLDGRALSAALAAHFAPPAAPAPGAPQGVSVDGKAHRGRLQYGPVHALTACCHDRASSWPTSRSRRGATSARPS